MIALSPQAMLIVLGAAGLWWGAHKTVEGVRKADHAIARKLHHPKPKPEPVK